MESVVRVILFLLALCFPFQVPLTYAQSALVEEEVTNVSAMPELDTSRQIAMTCGGTKIEIMCGYNQSFRQVDDRVCSDNKLIFTLSDGKTIYPKPPESFESGTTPIGISCGRARNRSDILLIRVIFLSGSYNCNKCFQDIIYKPNGEPANKEPSYKNDRFDPSKQNVTYIEDRNHKYPEGYLYEDDLIEITFQKIGITKKNIKRYSFLIDADVEVDAGIEDFSVAGGGVPPQYYIAKSEFNGKKIVIGGMQGSGLCGSWGCHYDFYATQYGGYKKLLSDTSHYLYFHKLYKAHCEKDYVVLGGGGGAGITRPEAGVWSLDSKGMSYIGPVQELNIENVCRLVREPSNRQ